LADPHPSWREQLIFEVGGDPIGFVQIIDPAEEESKYWWHVPADLRAIDIWIGKQENLGKGNGTIMMKLSLQRCFSDDKVTAVLIDPLHSNQRAHKFYERIGFRFIETRVFGEDTCRVYRLVRKGWEASDFNASPDHSFR
jgi:aminoglycoside 6'-N-acetyltransferase